LGPLIPKRMPIGPNQEELRYPRRRVLEGRIFFLPPAAPDSRKQRALFRLLLPPALDHRTRPVKATLPI
jgi:hypothetical protein